MRIVIIICIVLMLTGCSKESSKESPFQPTDSVPEFQRAYMYGFLSEDMLWSSLKTSFYLDTKLTFESVEYFYVWSAIDSQVLQIIPNRMKGRLNVITFPKTFFVTVGCRFELALNIHNRVDKPVYHNQGAIE